MSWSKKSTTTPTSDSMSQDGYAETYRNEPASLAWREYRDAVPNCRELERDVARMTDKWDQESWGLAMFDYSPGRTVRFAENHGWRPGNVQALVDATRELVITCEEAVKERRLGAHS